MTDAPFFVSPVDTVHFCVHGEVGGPCGRGICVKGVECACDPGYGYDVGFLYYPNCFAPEYLYPAIRTTMMVASGLGLVYGLWLQHEYKWQYLQNRLVVASNLLNSANFCFGLSHSLEGAMGAITQVFHFAVGLIISAVIVPSVMEMFLVPAYKFSEAPMKGLLVVYSLFTAVAFTVAVFAVVEGWRRQTLVANWKQNGHYGPINDTYSLIHLSAGLCLASQCVLFYFYSQRVISKLRRIESTEGSSSSRVRNTVSEGPTIDPLLRRRIEHIVAPSADSPNEPGREVDDAELSHLARVHLERMISYQTKFVPMFLGGAFLHLTLFVLHYQNRVFPYQYVMCILFVAPTPVLGLSLYLLVLTQRTSAASSSRGPGSNDASSTLMMETSQREVNLTRRRHLHDLQQQHSAVQQRMTRGERADVSSGEASSSSSGAGISAATVI